VLEFKRAVAVAVEVIGLVEQIPRENSLVLTVALKYRCYVRLKRVLLRIVGQYHATRALNPSAIVDAHPRSILPAALWIGIPHAIKEHNHRPDFVLGRNLQELVDIFEEYLAVVAPRQVVQKHANRVKAQRLGPTQLAIDRRRIECFGLPHLELIDRRARQEIAANKPGLGAV